MAITTLITANEITGIGIVDDHFSPNNLPENSILDAELLLANQFLGEAFYAELKADKTSAGVFATAKFQTLYDNYLKSLLTKYILLVTAEQNIYDYDNAGIKENANEKNIFNYKLSLSNDFSKSKDLTESYLTSEAQKSNFPNFLGNNIVSQPTKFQHPKRFAGFLIE